MNRLRLLAERSDDLGRDMQEEYRANEGEG